MPPVTRAAGRAIDAALGVLPGAVLDAGLRAAARCPPALRVPLFTRACVRAASSSRLQRGALLQTNFGLDRRLRCSVPFGKFDYLYGRPAGIEAERAAVALAVELSRDATDFIDVGAHEGLFTFAVHVGSGRSGPRLHVVEADEALFERLVRNLAVNHVEAHAIHAAATDQPGDVVFHRNLSDDASGSTSDYFAGMHETARVSVPAVVLAEYLATRSIDRALLKVDVEGAGEAVWRGIAPAAQRIGALIMEILRPEVEAALPSRIIAEGGLHAYYIRDFTLVPSQDGSFDYVAPYWNWLFCRLPPDALSRRLQATPFVVGA